jgi:methionyl aminopeptidase
MKEVRCLNFRHYGDVKKQQVVDNQGMNSVFTAEKDILGMREAGRLASEVLDHVTPFVKAGISTAELDRSHLS